MHFLRFFLGRELGKVSLEKVAKDDDFFARRAQLRFSGTSSGGGGSGGIVSLEFSCKVRGEPSLLGLCRTAADIHEIILVQSERRAKLAWTMPNRSREWTCPNGQKFMKGFTFWSIGDAGKGQESYEMRRSCTRRCSATLRGKACG